MVPDGTIDSSLTKAPHCKIDTTAKATLYGLTSELLPESTIAGKTRQSTIAGKTRQSTIAGNTSEQWSCELQLLLMISKSGSEFRLAK
jgi:hypothetical protein